MLKKIYYSFLFLISLFLFVNFSFAEQVQNLSATDYVNDFASVLTLDQKNELSKILGDLEKEKQVQVSVVLVKNMQDEFGNPDYIEHFAVKLFEKWGLGKAGSDKESDKGLLFLIAIEERKMRMEVGYGLESLFTDGLTKIIQDKYVSPFFKESKYFEGVNIAIEKIQQVLNEEETSYAKGWDEDLTKGDLNSLIIFLFIVFVNIFGWTISILGRTKEWYLGGILAFISSGAIAYILFGIAFGSVFAVVIITIFGFVLDYFVSKNYKYWESRLVDEGNKHGPDWWAGGTFGPGSDIFKGSGGSGFGGFGGGSSGGGGSSSSW